MELTNAEIRTNVFSQIIENSTALNYKIMGWKYLGTRLILYFDDCKQVYDWKYQSIESTADYINEEASKDRKSFVIQETFEKPEDK
jgi:hypothetical protein